MVAPTTPSEELPALYRAVLDGVAALERHGQRSGAAAIRREAIAAYSAAWNDRHRAVLVGLVERARRELGRSSQHDRPAPHRRLAFPAARER